MKPFVAIVLLLIAAPASAAGPACADRYCGPVPGLMTPEQLASLPAQPADARVSYGSDDNQFVDLRLPTGQGPHPVVVLVHGGCFKTYGSVADLAAMGDALEAQGIATIDVEYRRIDQPGGGWPNTYLDVGHAIDSLRALAKKYPLDLGRVVLVGHSAGGHLAMWAAARRRVPEGSALLMADPLRVRGVVDLAGPLDLSSNIEGYEALCRDAVITKLMGGTPASVPRHYAEASPIRLLPIGIPHVVVIGEHEDFILRADAEAYLRAARRAGDRAELLALPRVGHFEIASPLSTSWPRVDAAIRSLLE